MRIGLSRAIRTLRRRLQFLERRVLAQEHDNGQRSDWDRGEISALRIAVELMNERIDAETEAESEVATSSATSEREGLN